MRRRVERQVLYVIGIRQQVFVRRTWTHCPLPANLSGIGKWTHRSAYHDGRVEPAAGSGKVGVVQTWLAGDGRVDATCVRRGVSGCTLLLIAATEGVREARLLARSAERADCSRAWLRWSRRAEVAKKRVVYF